MSRTDPSRSQSQIAGCWPTIKQHRLGLFQLARQVFLIPVEPLEQRALQERLEQQRRRVRHQPREAAAPQPVSYTHLTLPTILLV